MGDGEGAAGRRSSARATIHDVAEAAGVSIKTVSRVLNREKNVRADTRERVLEAVEQLNYRPNISARSLASDRSYLIGLLYDNPSAAYVADVQVGALERCRREGYHVIVEACDSESPDAAETVRDLVAQSRLDGVILTPPIGDHPGILKVLEEEGVPFVRIAPETEAPAGSGVRMDDFAAARDMTKELLRLGHKRIGFIKGHPEHGSSDKRYGGYRQALIDAGIDNPPAEYVKQGYFSYKSGMECAEELLAMEPRPTAIFASNDDMAVAVVAAAHKRGLEVPRDLSVAGFDDTPVARIIWPQLTTVHQPITEMAAVAADLVISAARADRAEKSDNLLPYSLEMRDTTAPPGSDSGG